LALINWIKYLRKISSIIEENGRKISEPKAEKSRIFINFVVYFAYFKKIKLFDLPF